MNMRGAAGIRYRADRAKPVIPRPIRRRAPIALEVIIDRGAGTLVTDVMVAAVRVALPDLDPHVRDRSSGRVENTTGDFRDDPGCRPGSSGDPHQVVVRIGGK